jgi:hypothetical protein
MDYIIRSGRTVKHTERCGKILEGTAAIPMCSQHPYQHWISISSLGMDTNATANRRAADLGK